MKCSFALTLILTCTIPAANAFSQNQKIASQSKGLFAFGGEREIELHYRAHVAQLHGESFSLKENRRFLKPVLAWSSSFLEIVSDTVGQANWGACSKISSLILPLAYAMFLSIFSTVLCCWSLPFSITSRYFYFVSIWFITDKLDPNYKKFSVANIFQRLGADPDTVKRATLFQQRRKEEPNYESHSWMTEYSGIDALVSAVFGKLSPNEAQELNDFIAACRVFDDFHDLEEDRRDGKVNYFLTYPDPKPIEWWIRFFYDSLDGISNEQLKTWCSGWDKMYAIERASKPSLRREWELAEKRAYSLN